MSRIVQLDWRGQAIFDGVRAATAVAIDDTTAEAASMAASRRSGQTGNITWEAATFDGARTVGQWGLFPGPSGGPAWYELFVEAGGANITGDNARRNAADATYPSLAGRIAAAWGG